jgi:hypothetical protein
MGALRDPAVGVLTAMLGWAAGAISVARHRLDG